jgi:CelD/BcsL family acetyltransferase involved in cellulose biosynthesis
MNADGLHRSVTPLETPAQLPAWWAPLFDAAAEPSVFLSPAWMQSWLDVYGAGFSGSWLRWERGGETVGGCLLLRRRLYRRGLPVETRFINCADGVPGHPPPVEYNQILHVAGAAADVARDLAAAATAERWTQFVVAGFAVPEQASVLIGALPSCGLDAEQRPAPYVDLTSLGADGYLVTLSRQTRAQLRRSQRTYEEAFGPLSLDGAQSREQAHAYFEAMVPLHGASWRARGQVGAFASTRTQRFHRLLIDRLWPTGGVDVLRLRAGERTLGYLYGFVLRGKVYAYQSGFVMEANPHLKPGMLSHVWAIGHYAGRGLLEYDFLAGDMRYKRSLAKRERTLAWYTVYGRSWFARCVFGAKRLKRRLPRPRSVTAAAEADGEEPPDAPPGSPP